ncbi:hypothetical protein BC827DRAFT_577779 [Russula dissimulans]|nr:hypothetical protein BC827DRAFT_577779 [Russula dissimulans]
MLYPWKNPVSEGLHFVTTTTTVSSERLVIYDVIVVSGGRATHNLGGLSVELQVTITPHLMSAELVALLSRVSHPPVYFGQWFLFPTFRPATRSSIILRRSSSCDPTWASARSFGGVTHTASLPISLSLNIEGFGSFVLREHRPCFFFLESFYCPLAATPTPCASPTLGRAWPS